MAHMIWALALPIFVHIFNVGRMGVLVAACTPAENDDTLFGDVALSGDVALFGDLALSALWNLALLPAMILLIA